MMFSVLRFYHSFRLRSFADCIAHDSNRRYEHNGEKYKEHEECYHNRRWLNP